MPVLGDSESDPRIRQQKFQNSQQQRFDVARRNRDIEQRKIFFDTPPGKLAIAKALTKYLRWEVPRELLEDLHRRNQDYKTIMYYKDIWIHPEEFQEWHKPGWAAPSLDQIFEASKISMCRKGTNRFIWRWCPGEPTYNAEGARIWQLALTDVQDYPSVTHQGYDKIWEWIHMDPAGRPDFEEISRDLRQHDPDPQVAAQIPRFRPRPAEIPAEIPTDRPRLPDYVVNAPPSKSMYDNRNSDIPIQPPIGSRSKSSWD